MAATPHRFQSWDSLLKYYRSRAWDGWAFRGHRSSTWNLESTIERTVSTRFDFARNQLADFEDRLVRRFQRQAHHFISDPPPYTNMLEWLSLMQHHGAPTRLLDWTYSFYVAAFFAIEHVNPGDTCAIWAFDYRWCHKRLNRMYPDYQRAHSSGGHFLWSDQASPGVFPVNPFRLNERLVIQQGCFMAPGDLGSTFGANLDAMDPPRKRSPMLKLELRCAKDLLRVAYRELYRMNVTTAALFPGLDGFARGLGNTAAIPEMLAPRQPADPW